MSDPTHNHLPEEKFAGVLQTKFGVPDGNCFSACIASLLNLPIEEVPEYQCDYADEGWWEKWLEWFATRGLEPELWWTPPPGLAVMNMATPSHAVVVRDGTMIWNPHNNEPLPKSAVPKTYLSLREMSG